MSLLSYVDQCFLPWQKQFSPPQTVGPSASFLMYRIRITLTLTISTGLALTLGSGTGLPFPPHPQACLLQAKRVQQELSRPFLKSPKPFSVWYLCLLCSQFRHGSCDRAEIGTADYGQGTSVRGTCCCSTGRFSAGPGRQCTLHSVCPQRVDKAWR